MACWPIRAWAYADGEGEGEPIRIQTTSQAGIHATIRELKIAVQQADNAGATVLVFPELTAPPEAITALQQFLKDLATQKLAIVIVGTAHANDSTDPTRYRNRALVLGVDGGVLWFHDKIDPFTAGANSERLVAGTSIDLVITPLGSLAIAICKDMIGRHMSVIQQIGIEILFVPSMSNSTSAHQSAAQTISARQGTVSLVCNRPFHWETDSEVDPAWASFARLPGKRSKPATIPDRGQVVQLSTDPFLKVHVT
jgi:predicted amidohydrolase